MTSIKVISKTQRIVVDSNSAISIVNAGPPGPSGINGIDGVSPEVDMFVPGTELIEDDKGILVLTINDDLLYSVLHTDEDGKLKVSGPLTNGELRDAPVVISGTVATGGLTDEELRADPVVISGEVSTGALTDDELRAAPVVISGTVATGGLTDIELRADPVVISGTVATGGLTDEELRASPVNVNTGLSQALTDAELRAAPVVISGSVSTGDLTNTQLRATPVPVSGTIALDAPTLAALENTTITIDADSLAALETINISNLASTEFSEDSPHTSGDAGSLALAVRRDADTPSVSSDGDYSALHTDSVGKLKVAGPLTDTQLRDTPVPISGTVLANTGLAQPVTDTQLRATPVPVSGTVSTGALSDTQLRAAPVPISGTVTATTGGLSDTQLRASAVPVSGPVTDVQLRATPVPVSGTITTGALTDTQLRATAVPVSGSVTTGGLTDAQLRATAVPVSGTVALDATSLAAIENTTVTIDAASLAALETINVANIAGTEFAEDVPHTNGDAGSLVFAVRRDADTSSVSTDGDYAALLVDSLGRLKIKHIKDNQIVNGTMTIAISTSVSSTGGDANNGIIDLRSKALVGIQMPSVWTAAVLTFSVSMDGGTTYNDLYDDTMTERSISVVASRSITVDPTKFMGATHIKFRSGTGASAINQAAARTINYTTIAL